MLFQSKVGIVSEGHGLGMISSNPFLPCPWHSIPAALEVTHQSEAGQVCLCQVSAQQWAQEPCPSPSAGGFVRHSLTRAARPQGMFSGSFCKGVVFSLPSWSHLWTPSCVDVMLTVLQVTCHNLQFPRRARGHALERSQNLQLQRLLSCVLAP